MKTKRVNEEFHRLDVKLPLAVYEQISDIAVKSFDAKIHHISNKPEITPTLLYLLELGIESFTNGNELVKKSNTDNIPINDNRIKELIKDELIPVQSKLDELSELVYRLTNTDKLTDTLEIELNNDTDKEDITESNALSELPTLPLNEDLPHNIPENETVLINDDVVSNADGITIKSYEEAVSEIRRLKKQGLNNATIAKNLTDKYHTPKKTTTWRDNQVQRVLDKNI